MEFVERHCQALEPQLAMDLLMMVVLMVLLLVMLVVLQAGQRFKPVNRNLFAALLLDCGTCGLYSYCNPPDYGLPKRPWSAKRECFCLYVHHAPCTVTASRLRQCRHVQFALQHSSSQHSVPL